MTTTTSSSTPCVPGALAGGLTRTSLVDGMILNHDDLGAEQRYWRLKRRLTNRALGAGVVWGLKLCYDSQQRQFTLSPGYALDCCGNDLIVQDQQIIRASDLFDTSSPAFLKTLAKTLGANLNVSANHRVYSLGQQQTKQGDVAVILKYVECPEQPRAVLANACSTDTTNCQTSRVRETCKIDVAPPPAPCAPGPITKFLTDLQNAMNDPSQTPAVLANVFPGMASSAKAVPPPPAPPAPPPAPALPDGSGTSPGPMSGNSSMGTYSGPSAPLALHIRLGREERIVRLAGSSVINVPTIESVVPYDANASNQVVQATFELRPDPGYVLLTGTELQSLGYLNGVQVPGSQESVTAPFALDLAWTETVSLQGTQPYTQGTTASSSSSGGSASPTSPFPNQTSYKIGTMQITASYGQLFGGDQGSVIIQLGPRMVNNQTQFGGFFVTGLGNTTWTTQTEAQVALDGLQLNWTFGGGAGSGSGTTGSGGGASASYGASGSSSTSHASTSPVTSCLNSLSPAALFLDSSPDQGADPKTLLLAAMYAWLKLSLDGQDGTNPQSFGGGQTLAAWLYLTAWRMLFGANPAAPNPDGGDRAYLGQLLDSLFHQWCDGFFYPGPRCAESHHGVFLGTASVNSSGAVQSFSAWKGRRYVLTGPLLTHWMGQLGVAPVDVIASRFLQAICCFSSQPSVALGPMSALGVATTAFANGSPQPTFDPGTLGVGGVMLSDGYYLYYGDGPGAEQYFDAVAIRRKKTQGVGWVTLLSKMISAFMRSTPPGPEREYEHYYANGGQPTIHIVLSVEPSARGREKDAVRARIEAEIEEANEVSATPCPPLAYEPAIEWLSETMWNLPLVGLPSMQKYPAVQKALLAANVLTVGRAIALGAEQVRAALNMPSTTFNDPNDQAVNVLFGDLDKLVSTTISALLTFIGAQAGATPPVLLTRALLHDPNTGANFTDQFASALNPLLAKALLQSPDTAYIVPDTVLHTAADAIP
jgi:hypothetical protein